MIVALIPARGGSQRLPGKNIKPFAGKPLLSHSISLAQSIPDIASCVVSTEDSEIAEVAEHYGADVIKRPLTLADDKASTASVAQHALRELVARGAAPSTLVTLQPNCPLRPVSLVREALTLFRSHRPDSVVSVTQDHRKIGTITEGLFKPQYRPGVRSQDMAPRYFENGLVYVSDAKLVVDKGDLFGRTVIPLITDPMFALGDIDTDLDFSIAEFLFTSNERLFNHTCVET